VNGLLLIVRLFLLLTSIYDPAQLREKRWSDDLR